MARIEKPTRTTALGVAINPVSLTAPGVAEVPPTGREVHQLIRHQKEETRKAERREALRGQTTEEEFGDVLRQGVVVMTKEEMEAKFPLASTVTLEQTAIPVSDRVGLPPRIRFIKSVVESAKAKGNTNTMVIGVDDMEMLFEWIGYPVSIEGRRRT